MEPSSSQIISGDVQMLLPKNTGKNMQVITHTHVPPSLPPWPERDKLFLLLIALVALMTQI